MLETALAVALVGGAYTVLGASLAAVVNYYRAKLEERRIDHERQKWLLELHAHFEIQLHSARLQEYQPILAELERLSHFRINDEDQESILDLAGKLNKWGYGRAARPRTLDEANLFGPDAHVRRGHSFFTQAWALRSYIANRRRTSKEHEHHSTGTCIANPKVDRSYLLSTPREVHWQRLIPFASSTQLRLRQTR